jgi:hypothetical protein
MKDKSSLHIRYNFFYITFMLSAIIVVLLTKNLGQVSGLEKLLTFGLTLTSLCLSLIAIIFSIFSHFSFSRTAEKLQSVSGDISTATEKLTEVTTGVDEKLSYVATKDDIQRTIQESMGALTSKQLLKVEFNLNNEQIKDFLNSLPYIGCRALYIIVIAKRNNRLVNFDEIPVFHDYWKYFSLGFVRACSSFQLFKINNVDEIGFSISEINEYLKNNIEEYFLKTIKIMINRNPIFKEKYENDKKSLDNFFSNAN